MRKYLVVAGLACALATTWALPSFAVEATGTASSSGTGSTAASSSPSTGALTIEQMDTAKPFGDLAIDSTKPMADVYASLNGDQRSNLEARCNLIVPNADKFGQDVPTWCRSYLDWRKANHPNE